MASMGVTFPQFARGAPVVARASVRTADQASRGRRPASTVTSGVGVPALAGVGSRFAPGHAAERMSTEHAAVQFCGDGAACHSRRGSAGLGPGGKGDGAARRHGDVPSGEASRPDDVIGQLGPRVALPAGAQASFGSAYGAGLGDVSVHPDSSVPARYGATALTVGRHVAFAPGRYAPETQAGQELLGHELAHVVQQAGGTAGVQAAGGAEAGEVHEVEADAAARAAVHGAPVPRLSPVTAPAPQADDGPACFADAPTFEPAPQVCEAPPAVEALGPQVCEAEPEPAPAAMLTPTGTLAERKAAFKSLVRTTAILRLRGNQTNLDKWSALVTSVIPTGDLAAAGLLQTGGAAPYFELQDISDPALRELKANQAEGRYRLCTGCHIAKEITATRGERERFGGREWLTPNQQRAGAPTPGFERWATGPSLLEGVGGHGGGSAGTRDALVEWLAAGGGGAGPDLPAPAPPGYSPPTGTAEARLHRWFPDPEVLRAQLERARPILAALGPDGYKVLPADILAELRTGDPEALRARIVSTIAERREGYETLIGRIRSGSMGYEHFGPIINDLLPAADPEVRAAIQEEMDDKAFWDRVEAVVVGVLTVAALLLTIFPPTSAAGVMALGALEVGLGVYGAATGPGLMETGQAYSLGTGAHDVFSREQQEAGGMMVLGGFLGVALAPLAVVGGVSRMASATTRIGEVGLLGLEAGQTVQRGRYVMTLAEDGSMVVTLTDRADVMIIVRDGTATAYQVTGTGGLRVLESRPIMPAGAGPGGAGRGGGVPFEGEFPHVQQQQPNWCGAACGEMSAGRLGVEVSQEQLAGTQFFEPEIVIEGQTIQAGGFHSADLANALDEVAPVAGRRWVGGSLPPAQDISTAGGLRTHIGGYLQHTDASVILRVRGGNHWIIVDRLTPEGLFAIRDPALRTSSLVTAEELAAMRPTGQAVFSFPEP